MADKSNDKQADESKEQQGSFNGIVLKKRKSGAGKTYYSVLFKGKPLSIGNKRLVGFPSRATEGNITIAAMDNDGSQGEFASFKDVFAS